MKHRNMLTSALLLLAVRFSQATTILKDIESLPGAYQPLAADQRNASYAVDAQDVVGRSLFGRQSCGTSLALCPKYSKCCYPGEGCCPDGCVPSANVLCCANGGYCNPGKTCCGANGCIPSNADCCSDGGYCPAPFECIKLYSDGRIVCCTDTSCNVYLGNGGQTVTATGGAGATATATATQARTQTQYTSATITGTAIATNAVYQTYYTTIYWYYWFYYYTVYYAPSTYTTRVSTTVTRTTTLTTSATDSYEADIYFYSASSGLPTPASANSVIPPTPTPGALVVGSCSSSSTLSDGQVTSKCQSLTAGSTGTKATVTATSTVTGSSGGSASAATRNMVGGAGWMPTVLMGVGVMIGAFMVTL